MSEPPVTSDTPSDKFHGNPPAGVATPDEKPVSVRGKMTSFDGIRRQLTEEELKSPAVQKLLLDMIEDAIKDRDDYKSYVQAFHEADKRAAIFSERLNADKAVDVFFGSGMALGGVFCGLASIFWTLRPSYGIMCLLVGVSLIAVACVGRLVKR